MTDPTRLIDRYLDGKLSADELTQLEQDLAGNTTYADAFAKAMMLDELLKDRYERESITTSMRLDDGSFLAGDDLQQLQDDYDQAVADMVTIVNIPDAHHQRDPESSVSWSEAFSAISYGSRLLIRSKPMPFVGALVAAVVLLLLWVVNPFAGGVSSDSTTEIATPPVVPEVLPVVANLTAEFEAVWDRRPDQDLRAGQRLTLFQGFAEVTTLRGAIARIEAPATIELINDVNAIRLHSGRLVGLCHTESSKGFVVKTAHADITDLGTEFGVQVDGGRVTASVFTGEIELTTPGGEPQSLVTNQTARLSVDGNNRQFVVDEAFADGFEKLLPHHAMRETLRNDPAMIAYWGFEAEDLVDGKLLNRAESTRGNMDGELGQKGRTNSEPTLTEGRWPGTNALRFEAQEFDAVRIGVQDARLIDGLEQFTIGLWVKPDHMDQMSHHLVTKRKVGVGDVLNFGLSWDGTGGGYHPNAVFLHGRPGKQNASSTDSLQRRSVWMHLVVTYDRGVRSIYVDGVLLERLPRTDAGRLSTIDAELLIGAATPHLNHEITYLDGDLDELFILGRVMSPDEITTLYETGVAQP